MRIRFYFRKNTAVLLSSLQDISLDAALDFFYNSEVYPLMRDGVSDMHCMSDAYLAEELKMEYEQKNIEPFRKNQI